MDLRNKQTLGLCVFTHKIKNIKRIDLKYGLDIRQLDNNIGKNYKAIIAAPPCTQFTIANSRNWKPDPNTEIAIKCLQICESSNKPWLLENPIGRIDKIIPDLKQYRQMIFQDNDSTKKYVLYSNTILPAQYNKTPGTNTMPDGKNRVWKREEWTNSLIKYIIIWLGNQ